MVWDDQVFRNLTSGRTRGLGAEIARGVLSVLAGPYGVAVHLRNRAFDLCLLRSHRLARPVVSIGNLTVGGTGKTPLVEAVVRMLAKAGKRSAIISRGYKSLGAVNDEALVLQANLPGTPHVQGADRVAAAIEAIGRWSPDVLVLDDGFQHRRLRRDFDVVLLDATNPFGGGRLLPRGSLREPVASLRRANAILLTRADCMEADARAELRGQVAKIAPAASWGEVVFQPISWTRAGVAAVEPAHFAGKRAVVFCGVGNPAGFTATLTGLGVDVAGARAFPDHHHYTAKDFKDIERWAGRFQPEFLATTQKDFVKIGADAVGRLPLWTVRIEAVFLKGREEFERGLFRAAASNGA